MSNTLTIRNQMQFENVDKKVAGNNHLMVSVTAPVTEATKRIPVQIVLVLDVSGSMNEPCSNSKSKMDVMKDVAIQLVNYLRDEDRISIVSFDSLANVLCNVSGSAKEQAVTAIKGLHAGSATNTSGGIILGYEQVRTNFVGSTRVICMTDGHANAGVCDSAGLIAICEKRPDKVILSTFGFGMNANQDLLANMAKAGAGNYYFVDTADQVKKAFAEELGGAISCVAQNIKIKLKPNKDVKVVEVLNDFKVEDLSGVAVITADDIYSGETKNILIKLSLPVVPDAKPRASKVVDIDVSWFDTQTATTQEFSCVAKVSYVDAKDVSKDANLEVAEQIAILETAKAYREASLKADKRQFAEAEKIFKDVGRIWEDLKDKGSKIGEAAITNNDVLACSLKAENYHATMGHSLRSSSSNSMRSRSIGSFGSSNLGRKGATVEGTLTAFSTGVVPEKNVTVSIPQITEKIEPNSFVKERSSSK